MEKTTKYIQGVGIWYKGELPTIRKKEDTPLQPIYESFTNSLEAILAKSPKDISKERITISLNVLKGLFSEEINKYDFQRIVIEDTGIGFNDINFRRFVNLRDNQKGFSNRGTGRIQFIHTFDKTIISSIYEDKSSSTNYKKRIITLSKNEAFLQKNAIVRLEEEEEIVSDNTLTTVSFETILDEKEINFYTTLSAEELKEELIRHYLSRFCDLKNRLPIIEIKKLVNGEEDSCINIISEDIPTPDQEKNIEVAYSKVANNKIEQTNQKETFNLKAFVIPESDLKRNTINLVSKGEVAKELKIENLLPTEQIGGKRYLFLLSGKYIDERDSDTRGNIDIPLKKDFKKQNTDLLISDEAVLIDDIEEKVNNVIHALYTEIGEKYKEKEKKVEELQELFLLNPKTLKALQNKIRIDDDDEAILRKVYESDAKIIAEKDAEIKKQLEDLESLTPNRDDYQEQLKAKVNEFVKSIPLQNRTALTQYVARRKMVLELFQKILDKELVSLKNGGRIDEDLLHNLIFQQGSSNPESSDLWIINEDFIYFRGVSESLLKNAKIGDEYLLKNDNELSEEEKEYRMKQGGDAILRRTDILLFPREEKCIIIELKAPDINISDHLNQINRYASLINNLSKDSFNFTTFYGYLIGENIDVDDIIDNDTDFKSAHSLNYIFRPYKRIAGKFGKTDGSLYTEIIKYSTLLQRAKMRNKIFIEKLENTSREEDI